MNATLAKDEEFEFYDILNKFGSKCHQNLPNQEAWTSVNLSISFGSTFFMPRKAGITIVGKATKMFKFELI